MGIHEKFFLIEADHRDAQDIFSEMARAGHEVVGYADNLQDATELVSKIEESGASVIVLDGNLSPRRSDCEEGKEIAKLIKSKNPDMSIIAHSGSSKEAACYGDIYINKPSFGELAKAVTAFPR